VEQVIDSSETSPGFFAGIFLTKPNPKHTGITFPVELFSVYLYTVGKGEFFVNFNEFADKCVILSVPTYYELLYYFRFSFQAMAAKMDEDVNRIRALNEAVPMRKSMRFRGPGSTTLYIKLRTAILEVKRESLDPKDRLYMCLCNRDKRIQLDPEVMVQMGGHLEEFHEYLEAVGITVPQLSNGS